MPDEHDMHELIDGRTFVNSNPPLGGSTGTIPHANRRVDSPDEQVIDGGTATIVYALKDCPHTCDGVGTLHLSWLYWRAMSPECTNFTQVFRLMAALGVDLDKHTREALYGSL